MMNHSFEEGMERGFQNESLKDLFFELISQNCSLILGIALVDISQSNILVCTVLTRF